MSTAAIEILRRVNGALRSGLVRLQPERTRCSAIEAQELSALRREIGCAADCVRDLPANPEEDPDLQEQFAQFKNNLEQLKQTLPSLHSRLLAEHTRLAAAQTQLAAAGAWAQASKKTL